jgi:hypothetical protein
MTFFQWLRARHARRLYQDHHPRISAYRGLVGTPIKKPAKVFGNLLVVRAARKVEAA